MGNFSEAYKLTGHNEGGYSNNADDHGGETYAGISRKFWPNWPGWALVDKAKAFAKSTPLINHWLDQNGIEPYVAAFYKANFWDANKLDLVKDQQLANNIYDFGVNSGVVKAAKALQEVLKVSNDGIIGQQTINALNGSNARDVYNAYNGARAEFYHRLSANPGQLQFLKSWISRLKPYQIA